MSSGDRYCIIEMISERMGFDFREEDISPKLRREIGQIAEKVNRYEQIVANMDDAREKAKFAIVFSFFTVILGMVLAVLVTFWSGAIFFMFSLAGCSQCIKNKTVARDMKVEATSLWSDLDNRIEQLSESVYSELSLLHEAKVRPTVKHIMVDFSSIIQAARGKGIVLSNIECPHCNGTVEIPPTGEYFQCQYCGKTIYATKIFDKLKDLLTSTE